MREWDVHDGGFDRELLSAVSSWLCQSALTSLISLAENLPISLVPDLSPRESLGLIGMEAVEMLALIFDYECDYDCAGDAALMISMNAEVFRRWSRVVRIA